jgi:pimeloyl-ACP methyl ester carboxylesterase
LPALHRDEGTLRLRDGRRLAWAGWQGSQDSFVSRAALDWWARELPRCDVRVVEGEGHFLMYDHTEEILGTLAKPALMPAGESPKGAVRT